MSRFCLLVIALVSLASKAQGINYSDVQHIHTALKHLTVIDLGEPIQFIASADPDAFQIERAGDKILIQPLKEDTSTNLILWTSSRQVSYELDVPGDTAQMNVLIRNLPPQIKSSAVSQREREEWTSAAISKTLLDARDITLEREVKSGAKGVVVSVTRVLHASEGIYLEYRVENGSTSPFRITTPAVVRLQPSQTPISLTALRNHELSSRTLAGFKAALQGSPEVLRGDSARTDLGPGDSATGFVLIRGNFSNDPQILQLSFGATPAGVLTETVVI